MAIESSQIQKLYIAYFGRPADPSGVDYWLSNSSKDTKIGDISYAFYLQNEYKKSVVFDKPIDFQINQFYMNLFARKADFEVIKQWLELVEKGSHRISDLVCDLISSRSYEKSNNSIQLTKDFETLNSKLIAANLFTAEVASSTSWINLYQPESIDPWKIGKALNIGITFLSQFDNEKTA